MKVSTAYLAIKCIVSGLNVKELTKEQETDIKKVLNTIAVASYKKGREEGYSDGLIEGKSIGCNASKEFIDRIGLQNYEQGRKDGFADGMTEGILKGKEVAYTDATVVLRSVIESFTNTDKKEGI